MGNCDPCRPLECLNHFKHAIALSRSEVKRFARRWLVFEPLQRSDVGPGEIHHMDVVPDACAIRRGVVISEYCEGGAQAGGCLGEVRDEVVWVAQRKFANLAGWMGTNRIEVAQQCRLHGVAARAEIRYDALTRLFGVAIGGLGPSNGGLFVDRNVFGLPIDGATAGEHKLSEVEVRCCFEQVYGACYVVGIIFQGFLRAFANGFERSKMDDSFHGAPRDNAVEGGEKR